MAGFNARSADTSRHAMTAAPDVPRSKFRTQQTHKTAFDAGLLIPVYLDEVLPGDTHNVRMTAFVRLATPVVPIMDNLYLDTHFFFVPNRLVWNNWRKFMGEQSSPGASTTFLVPQLNSPADGFIQGSLADYFGMPTVGQVAVGYGLSVNALWFRAYYLIWNEWFRDQNYTQPLNIELGDGPEYETAGNHYLIMNRARRHDYFTSVLPWPMRDTSLDVTEGYAYRGGVPVSGLAAGTIGGSGAAGPPLYETGGAVVGYSARKDIWDSAASNQIYMRLDADGYPDIRVQVNEMRQAFAVQRLLERDARGGSRYTEIIKAHFRVQSPDARLQRPEYLGGGTSPITVNPVVQTSASNLTGGSTPLGSVSGVGTGVASGHGFSGSFTEHGMIIGLASVRSDTNYQQGLHKMFTRKTKFDYFWPALANLGEQPVLRQEIYAEGTAKDKTVFGYQERWMEYRTKINKITGPMKSYTAQPLDAWHLGVYIANSDAATPQMLLWENPPLSRVLAAGEQADGQQFLFDALFDVNMVRPVPAFSVPGLADHF